MAKKPKAFERLTHEWVKWVDEPTVEGEAEFDRLIVLLTDSRPA